MITGMLMINIAKMLQSLNNSQLWPSSDQFQDLAEQSILLVATDLAIHFQCRSK